MNIPITWAAAVLLLCATAYTRTEKKGDTTQTVESVEGCLSYTGDTFVITGGNTPRQFRVIGGDTGPLRGKLGHTVSVTGIVGTNDPVENTTQPPNEGTTTGVTYNTLVAQSVRDVASNCSYPGYEH